MAILVWLTTAVAIWHFTVFVPDRFWAGIVGAFLSAIAGSIAIGAIFQFAMSKTLSETDVATVLIAVPGALIGMGIAYLVGARQEDREAA
jgi:hypothetical protein